MNRHQDSLSANALSFSQGHADAKRHYSNRRAPRSERSVDFRASMSKTPREPTRIFYRASDPFHVSAFAGIHATTHALLAR